MTNNNFNELNYTIGIATLSSMTVLPLALIFENSLRIILATFFIGMFFWTIIIHLAEKEKSKDEVKLTLSQEELGKIRRLLKDEIYKRDEKENGNI